MIEDPGLRWDRQPERRNGSERWKTCGKKVDSLGIIKHNMLWFQVPEQDIEIDRNYGWDGLMNSL